ncbi:hypothetical protein CEUSTIGMA_g11809.t1 [Chlamydomonas eustigma]|uniref:ADP,ATP carrier protein n=1 Tax=Chlamydomonas eustigma TaxID=1157962 RepID=A0A250XMU6_9CHLO|nr:hypothetical protein CEUSTIGMA_g11809.t1 [Chlamydomonas eustigma]|eukprot:GAX84387.1 hypothetical protein CEUSTIGMA_g11809.t1 [Chlamydomonas eustigma]
MVQEPPRLNVQHQASISALWVLCADIFDNSAGTRLFGFIGGGSAVGQLLGSMFVVSEVKITAAAQRANPANPANPGKGLSTGPPTYLILVAAALLLAVAFLSFGLSESGKKLRPDMDIMSKHPIMDPECDKSKIVNIQQERMFKAPAMIVSILSAAKGQISNSMECSLLILRSPYLLAICAYILLQCCTSSQLYFTKAKVVSSQIQHADDRTTYYGLVNVMTATSIFSMQMLATGRIIRRFGLSTTLLMSPIIAFLGMLLILICPASTTAWVIAGAEITRKVAGNALTKPAREILFTVVSKKEKYLAKVFIDLVVMRLGDTAAAAMFEAFDVRSGLQFRAFLCMSCFMCLCWAFCALNLGYQHRQMNARKNVKAIL